MAEFGMPAFEDPDAAHRSEELRHKALEALVLIRRTPAHFEGIAKWLKDLPIPRAFEEKAVGDDELLGDSSNHCLPPQEGQALSADCRRTRCELELVDVEDETKRRLGPIVRRLFTAWDEAGARFFHHSRINDRFFDFGEEDALRILFLAALTFNRDFDGKEYGLGWSWDEPDDCTAMFEGRAWAWSLLTSGLFAEPRLLELINLALEYESRIGPSAAPEPEPDCQLFAHGSDFTWIIFDGRKYEFTKGLQAECIKHLWNEWETGGRRNGCGLSEKSLGELAGSGSNSFRLVHAFRGHPIWGTALRPCGRGVFGLFSEPQSAHTS